VTLSIERPGRLKWAFPLANGIYALYARNAIPRRRTAMSGSRDDQQRAGRPAGAPVAGMPAIGAIVAETSFRPRAAAGLARGGVAYRIVRTAEVDPYDRPVAPSDIPAFGAPDLGVLPAARGGDRFQGTSRKAAKLSIADAAAETFGDLRGLIASLPADTRMKNHRPRISKEAASDRVNEEKRNIRVRAFLYAASREDDNDFHLIIGTARNAGPPTCMTMELSGLPPSSSRSYRRLKKARDAYKAFFGTNLPGMSYDFYPTPIPVEIEGSLFFDISHADGQHPGPQSLRPFIPTIWEVHPITRIVFEP